LDRAPVTATPPARRAVRDVIGENHVMMIVHGSHRRRELRRIAKAFRVAGALAPERAKPLAQLGLADSRLVRSFVDKRIIREVRAGEFYLDDDAWRAYQAMQLRWMAVPVALAIALLVWGLASGRH
jgi:hypothetical protein